jgi:hypothetical protein
MYKIIVKSVRKHISKKNPAHGWLTKERVNSLHTMGQLFFFKQTRPKSNQDEGAIGVWTMTIGIVPFSLRHCLLSSSFDPLISNSRREFGRPSNDWMPEQLMISKFCSELGRVSLGSDWIPEQLVIFKFCSELGRVPLAIDRMAKQHLILNSVSELGSPSLGIDWTDSKYSIANVLRSGSPLNPAGTNCSLGQEII